MEERKENAFDVNTEVIGMYATLKNALQDALAREKARSIQSAKEYELEQMR